MAVSILALIVLLAAVSLVLPFVLRVSRMMWVAVFAGLVTALLSAAIAVAVDVDGPSPVPASGNHICDDGAWLAASAGSRRRGSTFRHAETA